jgi:serine protease
MKKSFKTVLLLTVVLTVRVSEAQKWQWPEGVTGADVVPHQLVIKFKHAESDIQLLQSTYLVSDTRTLYNSGIELNRNIENTLYGIYELTFGSQIDHEKVINEIYQRFDVVYVEPVYIRNTYYSPNDPLKGNQEYLQQIRAFEAWDVLRDASNVIIAIIDSGVELNHSDLNSVIYLNQGEIPGNGIDDDGDGYVDNYLGWDFVGSSISAILNAGSPINWSLWEDNNPNTNGSDHGTHVAGIAAAAFDNGIGISGVAAKSKIMVLKCGEDGGGSYPTSILRGYEAIKYAAERGAHIINCSWGGAGSSQFEQDIINYATELGSLVVAASGNTGSTALHYPAAYENVLSVGNVTSSDQANSSSTRNYMVDVSAPGTGIFSTVFNSLYGSKTGTSMASPIAAGVAAMVKAKYPHFSPAQIAQHVRITSDDVRGLSGAQFFERHGYGRVNLLNALTNTSPAVRFSGLEFIDDDLVIQAGDVVSLKFKLTNYLQSVTGLTGQLFIRGGNVTILNNSADFGDLSTMESKDYENVFQFKINDNAPDNLELTLRLEFTGSNGYSDWQAFTFVVNQTYLNIQTPEISSTVTSIGRLGYLQAGQTTGGLGFVFDGENLLYEMGLLVGNSSEKLSNTIRSTTSTSHNHFNILSKVKSIQELSVKEATFDLRGTMRDNNAPSPLGVEIAYKALAWDNVGNSNYYIVEYDIKNISGNTLSNLYTALFADWDLLSDPGANMAGFDETRNLGFVTTTTESGYFVGLAPLNEGIDINYKAFSNSEFSFSVENKFAAISGGIGTTTVASGDVSHFSGVGPFTLENQESNKVAFVVCAGGSVDDLRDAYDKAHFFYNTTLQIARPPALEVLVCNQAVNHLSIDGFDNLRWYDSETDGNLIFEGDIFITDILASDVTYYVASVVSGNEGLRSPIKVIVTPKTEIEYEGGLVLCNDATIQLVAPEGDEFLWSNGETTREITVSEPDEYYVEVTNLDVDCTVQSEILVVTASTIPDEPVMMTVTPFCLGESVTLEIEDPSLDLVYIWEGPGGFLQEGEVVVIDEFETQNIGSYNLYANNAGCLSSVVSVTIGPILEKPTIAYQSYILTTTALGDSYQWFLGSNPISGATASSYDPDVSGVYSLRVSKDGCEEFSNELNVVIASVRNGIPNVKLYPNPVNETLYVEINDKFSSYQIFDITGRLIRKEQISIGKSSIEVSTEGFITGMYLIVLQNDKGNKVVEKFYKR